MNKVGVRNRIREFRARHNLTQEQLADRVGVRRETIGHIENGRYNLSLMLAYNIATALETTIEELFAFEPGPGNVLNGGSAGDG